MITYTLNLDSNSPVHIAHNNPKYGGEGIKLTTLWYPDHVTSPDPTLPPGTARTKKGVLIKQDNLDEFTMTFLKIAYDINPGDLEAAADMVEHFTDGTDTHIVDTLRKIANAITDPEQDPPNDDVDPRGEDEDVDPMDPTFIVIPDVPPPSPESYERAVQDDDEIGRQMRESMDSDPDELTNEDTDSDKYASARKALEEAGLL